MLPLLLLLLAANPAPADGSDVKIAAPSKVRPSDILLPAGASLRAAAWEALPVKPTAPRHVALACLVLANEGTPVSCIPAAPKLKAANLAQWNTLFDAYNATPALPTDNERSLADIAIQRVLNTRLRPDRSARGKTSWKLMIFDEIFAPADERPHPPAGEALTMAAVALDKPLDPEILRALYPMIAQRYQVAARVTITCHIEPALTLLCRQPGTVDPEPAQVAQPAERAQMIYTALVFASYQAASTIRLAPKAKDGRDVAGKDLTLSFKWALPEGEAPAARPEGR